MNNPFQEQLLKAGIATKQQVKKAQQDKKNIKKQQRSKKQKVVDEAAIKARQLAEQKANRDRELNKKKQEDARKKAISVEINQLIADNKIQRDENCEIIYNFVHNNKVKSIYINEKMKQQIMQAKLAIARIQGRYELVPVAVAEKIKQRNDKRVIIFNDEDQQTPDENDPYAEYQIPDDLMW